MISLASTFRTRLPGLATLVLAALLVAACGGQDEQRTVIQDIAEAYEQARESVARGNYRRGIQIYEAIQARYPFSELSRQIQLELMYAYYKAGQKELAIEVAETFMRENPIHPRVDYAMYIQALSYFEGGPGFLERWFRKDINKRPPKDVEQSYVTLRRLVEPLDRDDLLEAGYARRPSLIDFDKWPAADGLEQLDPDQDQQGADDTQAMAEQAAGLEIVVIGMVKALYQTGLVVGVTIPGKVNQGE